MLGQSTGRPGAPGGDPQAWLSVAEWQRLPPPARKRPESADLSA